MTALQHCGPFSHRLAQENNKGSSLLGSTGLYSGTVNRGHALSNLAPAALRKSSKFGVSATGSNFGAPTSFALRMSHAEVSQSQEVDEAYDDECTSSMKRSPDWAIVLGAFKANVGPSLLLLPKALQTGGILFSLFALCLLGTIATMAVCFLVDAAKAAGTSNYSAVILKAAGPGTSGRLMAVFVSVSIVMIQLGLGALYFVFLTNTVATTVGDLIPYTATPTPTLKAFFLASASAKRADADPAIVLGDGNEGFNPYLHKAQPDFKQVVPTGTEAFVATLGQNAVLISLFTLLLAWTTWVRDIAKLALSNLLADAILIASLAAIFVSLGMSARKTFGHEQTFTWRNPLSQVIIPSGIGVTMGTCVLVFEGIGCVLPLYASAENPDRFKMLWIAAALASLAVFSLSDLEGSLFSEWTSNAGSRPRTHLPANFRST